MPSRLHTIIETPEYISRADKILGRDGRDQLVSFLAANPKVGDAIRGTGGARKFRWAATKGKGKSGGARVVSIFSGANVPIFLLDIYGKDEKDNLTMAERNTLKVILRDLVKAYQTRKRRSLK